MYYGLFQDQVVVGGEYGWWWYFPRHKFNGTILNNINMPLLWVIIDTALTLLNRLIRKLSVQFLGSCISVEFMWRDPFCTHRYCSETGQRSVKYFNTCNIKITVY